MARIDIEKFLIVAVGDTAPDFVGKSLDGQEVRLSDFSGKAVLLDFWATWCAPCVAELPNVHRVYERFGKDGQFAVIGISLDDDEQLVRRFVRRRELPWPQIVAGPADRNPLAKQYNVTGIPATFLIDAHGRVVAKDLRGDALERELAKLIPPGPSAATP